MGSSSLNFQARSACIPVQALTPRLRIGCEEKPSEFSCMYTTYRHTKIITCFYPWDDKGPLYKIFGIVRVC